MKAIVAWLLFLMAAGAMAEDRLRAVALEATSANYLKVRIKDGSEHWVRMAGVICDEPETAYGREARRQLLKHVKGKNVWLKLKNMDENNIRAAEVIFRSRNINALLLQEGLCQIDPEASPTAFLERAQKIAITRKKGRWGPTLPVETDRTDAKEVLPVEEDSPRNGGFDNQSFLYTVGGMGFLALMIMISRKRSLELKRAKAQEEVAELIRQKNKELDPDVIPVDLTSNVLVAPIRATPPQPPTMTPTGVPSKDLEEKPFESGAASVEKGHQKDDEDPLMALLTDEDRDELEKLGEKEREKLLEIIREQHGMTD